MRRRAFIATTGIGLLAGCTTGQRTTDDGAARTPTASPSPTPTSTPVQTTRVPTPTVDAVSLVSGWETPGDLEENAITQAAPDGDILVATRYSVPVHEGEFDATVQATVENADGTVVGEQAGDDQMFVEETGVVERESAIVFDATEWDRGSYTVEVTVRDNEGEASAEPSSASFELSAPITDVEVTSIDTPTSVVVGERYQFSLDIENESGRDGTVQSPVTMEWADRSGRFETVRLSIPAGKTRTYSSQAGSFRTTGEALFTLEATGTQWRVSISSQ